MKDNHLRTARPIWLISCFFFCNCQNEIYIKENVIMKETPPIFFIKGRFLYVHTYLKNYLTDFSIAFTNELAESQGRF